jgi:DDE superfamily endonuclease
MLAALGSHGVEAVMTIDGATDAEVFRSYVEQVLRQVLYWPPYSPDWSPIEPCWSKLKRALRTAKARPRAALEQAIAQALATITVADAQSWFHHCGYALQ